MADLKIFTTNIEEKALEQINTLASQKAFDNSKIRIMPDVHAGKGCVIGFTADLGDKVIPNIVGVDIGCGVLCTYLGNIDIDLKELDNFIKKEIPLGKNVHSSSQYSNMIEEDILKKLYCYNELKEIDYLTKSLGTLGGGNHFIELDVDEDNNKYLLIHTGSRNLGKQVATIYQHKANEYIESCKDNEVSLQKEALIREYKATGREKEIYNGLQSLKTNLKDKYPPKDLSYLEGDLRDKYLHDMKLCQVFASLNRAEIKNKICKFLNLTNVQDVESVHNYIDNDNMVRKGSISARKGEQVVIPLNMRDGVILGVGKGNEDWNNSAPHGAGRLLSRAEARKSIKLEEFQESMQGIYSTSIDYSTIDESPMAYKDMNEILYLIKDTVDIKKILHPIYNIKAAE